MISEAERNYEPKTWTKIEDLPSDLEGLSAMELFYFCNSDSSRFKDFINRQRTDEVILLDYELLSLGFDPICGSMLQKTQDRKLILTIFTADGIKSFITEDKIFAFI